MMARSRSLRFICAGMPHHPKRVSCSSSRRTSISTPYGRRLYFPRRLLLCVLVVLDAEVRDLLLTHQPAQRILQLGVLNEEVILGVQPGRGVRTLEVEREPFLHS